MLRDGSRGAREDSVAGVGGVAGGVAGGVSTADVAGVPAGVSGVVSTADVVSVAGGVSTADVDGVPAGVAGVVSTADVGGVPAGVAGGVSTADVAGVPAGVARVGSGGGSVDAVGVVGVGVGGGVSGVLSLRRLGAGELLLLGREGLVGVLGDIERMVNRLAGYRVEAVGALEALSDSGAAPDATPHLTLREAAGVSDREARQMLRAARKARKHDTVLDALTSGDINAAQAEAISDARVPEAVRAELAEAAAAQHTDQTRHRVREAETQHGTESATQRAKRQRAARAAGWGRDHEGMLKLWARFDPETGAHIEAALEQMRRSYWNNDKQQRTDRRTPAQRDADALAYALAGITHTDADAQAVADLIARTRPNANNQPNTAQPRTTQPGRTEPDPMLPGPTQPGRTEPDPTQPRTTQPGRTEPDPTQPDPTQPRTTQPGPHRTRTRHGCRPADQPNPRTRTATQPRTTQPGRTEPGPAQPGRGNPGTPALHPARSDESPDQMRWLPPAQINVLISLESLRAQTDQAGVTDAGTELAPETVRKLACDAEIIPIILGGTGGSADIGRARRTVPLRLRRLLIARDRHCKWPGCRVPPSRCDAHHIIHWTAKGPTNLANLVLLCHTHHHHLHEHSYQLISGPDGNWTPIRETHQHANRTPKREAAEPQPAKPQPTARHTRAP